MTPPRHSIAFLGLGTMGHPMATNLLKAGFPLTVWNRTPERAALLKESGAAVAASAAEAAARADVVITMVSAPADVEAVVLGPAGAAETIRRGAVLIDMSTVGPETSLKVAAGVRAKGADFLDAPVVGSKGPATAGTLVILVGGAEATLERCRLVLQAMGKTIVHAGDTGKGAALKLATNLMLAHLAAGFAEAIALVRKAGVEPARYLDVLNASTFNSPWYQSKGAGMLAGDFAPHFALKHMHKDLRLMLDLARERKLILPVTQAVEGLFADSESAGLAEQDYSAILMILERMAAERAGTSP